VKFFVYGTLRPGGQYWPRLAPWVVSVGETGTLRGHSLFAGPAYPLAAPTPEGWGPATGVVGEPVEVADDDAAEVLAELDTIEGAPQLFYRVLAGELWVYLATPETLLDVAPRPVPTGDWFDARPSAQVAWESALATPYLGSRCVYEPV
jgi:gamma-glutamylcyclotransferase (GGCT)/AIG2-like uncharacterized protein YtfP